MGRHKEELFLMDEDASLDDVYDNYNEQLENGIITAAEAGFMRGYNNA